MHSSHIGLLMLLLLAGCASAYNAPQEGNTAKIRFVNASNSEDVDVFTFDNDQCSDAKLIGALRKRKYPQEDTVTRQGMPLVDGINLDRIKEIVIPSDRPFVSYIRMLAYANTPSGGVVTTSCRITFSFTPEKDGLYEVAYHLTERDCHLLFYKIVKDQIGDFKRVEEPSAINRNIKQCSY